MSDPQLMYQYAPRCDYDLPELIDFELVPTSWGGGLTGYELKTGGDRFGQLFPTLEAAERDAPRTVQWLVDFWAAKLGEDRSNKVVVKQHHYSILPEDSESGRRFAGHGGRQFWLKSLNDQVITVTRNLWAQGRIPDWFLAHFPDTHEFVWPVPDGSGRFTNDPAIAFPPRNRYPGFKELKS